MYMCVHVCVGECTSQKSPSPRGRVCPFSDHNCNTISGSELAWGRRTKPATQIESKSVWFWHSYCIETYKPLVSGKSVMIGVLEE